MKVIARQLRLVTLITVGWCLQAQAQPTDFSLPPLPGSFPTANGDTGTAPSLPPMPFPPNAGAKKDSAAVSETADAPAAAPDAIPELANLPIPAAPAAVGATAEPAATTTTAGATTTDKTPATPPGAPALPPAIAEGTDTVAGENTNAPALPPAPVMTVAAPPNSLPGFDLPAPPTAAGTDAPITQAATTLQEISVEAPPKLKFGGRTWNTKLAPAIIPKNTSFNYRRQVLPDAIYRAQYDYHNKHLPARVTREDYARYLAERVAANDINGTRALLNEGLSVNTTDGYGQTLLSIARRFGARDTERLLIARGAS